MIKGIIFDMDGVMIDSERQSNLGWEYAGKQLGEEIPSWLCDSFKGAPAVLSKKFFDDHFQGRMDYWEARKLRDEYVHRLREKEGIPVKKGLFELLDYLKQMDIRCIVATSTRKESAEKTLHEIGAWPYLSGVIYGDQVEHGKPEPDIFLKASQMIDVPVDECFVIEDSINGIKAGYAAHIKVIHIPDTIKVGEDVRKLIYNICDDLSQVIDVIKRNEGQ